MTILLTLLDNPIYIIFPQGFLDWIGWISLLLLVLYTLRVTQTKFDPIGLPAPGRSTSRPGRRRFSHELSVLLRYLPPFFRESKNTGSGSFGSDYRLSDTRNWLIFAILMLCVPLTSLFLGIQITQIPAFMGSNISLPPPGVPVDPPPITAMVFSAIPWMLAAGLLGATPAALLAALSGLLLALVSTHNSFTPLVMAILATLFATAVNQRYRTWPYRILRYPLVSAGLLSLIYPVLFILIVLLTLNAPLTTRIDYAINQLGGASLANGIELLIGGIFAQVLASTLPGFWGSSAPLTPAPSETSLQNRLTHRLMPFALILTALLMTIDWVISTNVAWQLLERRMMDIERITSDSALSLLEIGQERINQIASDPRLYTFSDPQQTRRFLSSELDIIPYYNQLLLYDDKGMLVMVYPNDTYTGTRMPLEEQKGIQLALQGFPIQTFTIPPDSDELAALLSFVAPVKDGVGTIRGVIVGRTDLGSNPFAQPIHTSLRSVEALNGQAFLVDENENVIIHNDPSMVMSQYRNTGSRFSQGGFYNTPSPDSRSIRVYYQPVSGWPWATVILVPAQTAQEIALDIAVPLLLALIGITFVTVIVLHFGIRSIAQSLASLNVETSRISRGNLDQSLLVPALSGAENGIDEIGQLRHDIEQMRANLKARLDEQDQLLSVSQGVASSLDFEQAVQPILDAGLSTGASTAHIVLVPNTIPGLAGPGAFGDGNLSTSLSFGKGRMWKKYRGLDEQILNLTQQHKRLVLDRLSRSRLLEIPGNFSPPASLFTIEIRHENQFYGAYWVAYEEEHRFNQAEVRFQTTLAGYVALATTNARLFQSAESGRQRLAYILVSNPDPILVTDQHKQLLFANPAAQEVLGIRQNQNWSHPDHFHPGEAGNDTLGDDPDGYGVGPWTFGDGEKIPLEKAIQHKELLDLLSEAPGENQPVPGIFGDREIRLPNGQIFLATTSFVSAEGQPAGRVCVLRDITRFKELNALKSEFVATASHDLRSPLALIRGYTTMLEMVGELNEQQTSYLEKIADNVDQMSHLVNNLLDLSRIESGAPLKLEMVPVRELVDRVIRNYSMQAAQKRIQISVDIPIETVPMIEADRALLLQALGNLIDNAIKFNKTDGKVDVRIETQSNHMIFIIADSGRGISPVDQMRMFEKFHRITPLSLSRSNDHEIEQRGSGLGLAIVKSIVDRHGGEVWLESRLGTGSTFYLAIPFRQPSSEELG